MKLNLGCGQHKLPGYVNVDKYDTFEPDVVFDLERFPWPFDESSAEEIVLHHCLEHMGRDTEVFLQIMQELYRVSAPKATITIDVPHERSYGFAGDPTHVRPINENILSLFSMKNNRKWKELGWPNTPLASYLKVDFDVVQQSMVLQPYWLAKLQSGEMSRSDIDFAVYTYFNVVDGVTFVLRTIKPFIP